MFMILKALYEVPQSSQGDEISIYPLNSACFSGDTIWAIGSTQLLRSQDRGNNWENIYGTVLAQYGANPIQLYAPNESICLLLAHLLNGVSKCIVTLSKGHSWNEIFSSSVIRLTAIHFFDQQHGFLAGHSVEVDHPFSVLLRTEDAGMNWQTCAAPPFVHSFDPPYMRNPARIRFRGFTAGCMLCRTDFNKSVLYWSVNGGQEWTIKGVFKKELHDCLIAASGAVVVVGAEGFMACLKPGESDWKTICTSTSATIYEVKETEWGYYAIGHDYDDEFKTLISTVSFSKFIDNDWETIFSLRDDGLFCIYPYTAHNGILVSDRHIFAYNV